VAQLAAITDAVLHRLDPTATVASPYRTPARDAVR
jgi:hypothetical protein